MFVKTEGLGTSYLVHIPLGTGEVIVPALTHEDADYQYLVAPKFNITEADPLIASWGQYLFAAYYVFGNIAIPDSIKIIPKHLKPYVRTMTDVSPALLAKLQAFADRWKLMPKFSDMVSITGGYISYITSAFEVLGDDIDKEALDFHAENDIQEVLSTLNIDEKVYKDTCYHIAELGIEHRPVFVRDPSISLYKHVLWLGGFGGVRVVSEENEDGRAYIPYEDYKDFDKD